MQQLGASGHNYLISMLNLNVEASMV
uniref:Uncharacterized protein n=1 Tax=Anguilla anguilla TaxID=7936 RepID=A0A0E9QZX0_ANGAN